ncbi:hypothetical protein IWGMT90018_11240 [Mycobacterium kiyosense]|nr:hypothetical protein IWGMT90018_11240 [Mycobacterium kiyosense]
MTSTSKCVWGITAKKVGEQGLADPVDPVHVFDDEDGGGMPGQRRGIDQRGQPPSPSIRIDLGQPHLRVGDAQQVLQQQHIRGGRVGYQCPDSGPGGRIVEAVDAGGGAQQPRHDPERDVARVRVAAGGEHLDPAGRCRRAHLARQAALADAR